MRAGRLDRLVVIEELTETQDSQGEPQDTWAAWATVWAEVRDVSGREYFQAQAVQSSVDTIFRIRHIANLTHKMRILSGGVYYNIKGIAEIGRSQSIEIQATKVAA